MDNKEAQESEAIVLKEVLGTDIFNRYPGVGFSGFISVDISLPNKQLKLVYQTFLPSSHTLGTFNVSRVEHGNLTGESETDADSSYESRENPGKFKHLLVHHLPPILLHFSCPSGYPSQAQPDFTLSSNWVNRKQLSYLCKQLDEIWENNKGMSILYLWVDFLKEQAGHIISINREFYFIDDCPHGQYQTNGLNTVQTGMTVADPMKEKSQLALRGDKRKDIAGDQQFEQPEGLDKVIHEMIRSNSKFHVPDDARAVLELTDEPLLQYLQNFNEQVSHLNYLCSNITCGVCSTDKRGADCFQFDCGHVFCQECVRQCFTMKIKSGDYFLSCLEYQCETPAQHHQVESVVSGQIFNKFDKRLLISTLESSTTVSYCPRKLCQQVALLQEDGSLLAVCSTCHFSFCLVCRKVWHGVNPCSIITKEKRLEVFEAYKKAAKKERSLMEQKYGKKDLSLLVNEVESESWLRENSKPCPQCCAPINKFEGCNKVRCSKCKTSFCWLCGYALDSVYPYLHFNDESSPCYQKLHLGNRLAEEDLGLDEAGNLNVMLQQFENIL